MFCLCLCHGTWPDQSLTEVLTRYSIFEPIALQATSALPPRTAEGAWSLGPWNSYSTRLNDITQKRLRGARRGAPAITEILVNWDVTCRRRRIGGACAAHECQCGAGREGRDKGKQTCTGTAGTDDAADIAGHRPLARGRFCAHVLGTRGAAGRSAAGGQTLDSVTRWTWTWVASCSRTSHSHGGLVVRCVRCMSASSVSSAPQCLSSPVFLTQVPHATAPARGAWTAYPDSWAIANISANCDTNTGAAAGEAAAQRRPQRVIAADAISKSKRTCPIARRIFWGRGRWELELVSLS